MSLEWLAYTCFAIALVVIPCLLYYLFLKLKRDIIHDILDCKKNIFDLFKEVYYLTLDKNIHDEKVNSFIVGLQAPQGNKLSSSKLNADLTTQEVKFKSLLAREEFLSLCKERTFELISILSARHNKMTDLIMKFMGVDGNHEDTEESKKSLSEVLFAKGPSQWTVLLEDLKDKLNNLKGNKNLLIHSFSSWEKEVKAKILSLEAVGS